MYTELEDITFDQCLSVVYNDLKAPHNLSTEGKFFLLHREPVCI